MLYQIINGTVSRGGSAVLSHIDFEIRGTEKIAIVGKNGAGKTTLLELIAGTLSLDRDDKRGGPGIMLSRSVTVGMLSQQAFADKSITVEALIVKGCPEGDKYARERFEYEREYDRLFTGFGFSKEDKKKRLEEFSGGEQTKIGFIRLLMEKPDILLLDEPTNHLDTVTIQWLEDYLNQYEKAVVMVSHDRFFLDRTAEVVYEVSDGRLTRYPGNYTAYREEKRKRFGLQMKAYERQQEELARLDGLVERFKHKPTKASFARSKKKAMDRMDRIPKPEEDDVSVFTGDIEPLYPGSKWVFEAGHLKLGYKKPLLELSLRVKRGQKIGVMGANGVGKTAFLKTVAGFIPPLDGECSLGNHVVMGYFDQHSAEIQSDLTVAEHYHDLFPALTEKEVRSRLGAYLFGGREAAKKVSSLSGGEKARLVLAELLESRPNFLILDEPTNHMDILAKETLESAFRAYKGTILFVSHDRYFMKQVAESILIFEEGAAFYYPFGYEHYLDRKKKEESGESPAARIKAEEQALIAGMRAVPKAERHRIREVSTDSAYKDWKMRTAGEHLSAAGKAVEEAEEALKKKRDAWLLTKEFWDGEAWEEEEEYRGMELAFESLWRAFHEQCLEWYGETKEIVEEDWSE